MSLSHRLPRQHHHFAARFCTAAVTAATITAADMIFAAVFLTRSSALRRRRSTATATFSFCPSLTAATPTRFHTSPPTLPPAPPPLHRRSRRSTANITHQNFRFKVLHFSRSTTHSTPAFLVHIITYTAAFPPPSQLLSFPARASPVLQCHFPIVFNTSPPTLPPLPLYTAAAAATPPPISLHSSLPHPHGYSLCRLLAAITTTTNAEAHTWPSGHQFLPPSFLRYSSYRQPLPTAGTSPCYRLLRQLHYSPPFQPAALPSCRLA